MMKLRQLTAYWDAEDAHLVITFLDELRDALWAAYEVDIIEMQRADAENSPNDTDSFDPECDDF